MTRLVSIFGLFASLIFTPPRDATFIVTVVDPSGAVLPHATVTVRGPDALDTVAVAMASDQGIATVANLVAGRYAIQVEFSGFETVVLQDVAIKPGEHKRVRIALPLHKVEDAVTVTRDAQAIAADPRGPAFGSSLTREEIDALSDDPTELAQQLLDLAGGNAVIRVDGFNGGTTGGAIPPKSLIKSIRIDRDRFAAEHHSPDFDEIQIVTQPGIGPLRGGGSWRWRDGALSGSNPFAATKPPERTLAYQANVGGTLVPKRLSFSLSANRTASFETPLLNVALPGSAGGMRAEVLNLRRPNDSWNTYDLLDYAITPNQLLRVAYVQTCRARKNLGVGAYDLPERAYSTDAQDHELRVQEQGPLGTHVFASTRLGLHWSGTASRAAVEAPTIRVLDAFTSGGAQVSGGRQEREMELATDIDYTRGQHAIRAGLLLEGGRFRSNEASNYLGTYTFPSLAAYAADQPASYTRRVGDPLIVYWNLTAGAYIEDDFRIGKSLTLSPGVRYEAQTHVRDLHNLSPRLGVTWAPFTSGHTTVRVTYGFFYDWLRASTYEQTLRLNGVREQELYANGAQPSQLRYVLAPDLPLSTTMRFAIGLDQTIDAHLRASVSYYVDHDDRVLRGRKIGDAIEAVPDAAFRGGQFEANLSVNLAPPGRVPKPPLIDWRRENMRVSYTFSRQENNYDGPFSVPPSGSLAAEWGPASFNRRHRLQASFTSQAIRNLTAMLALAANTGTPYSITTGFDDNGDTIFNDRPAGVGRNTLRMPGQVALSANLSYAIPVDRYRLTWTVNAMNVTNHANYTGYSGVLSSPFFMRPTTVQNPRKVDIGMSFSF